MKIHPLLITTFSPGSGGAYTSHFGGIGKRWSLRDYICKSFGWRWYRSFGREKAV